MPRYFFDVEDGRRMADTLGVDLADLAEARQMAADMASGMLDEASKAFWTGEPYRLLVRDEWGLILLTLDLIAAQAPACLAMD